MSRTDAELYRFHCANLRALEEAFRGVQLTVRRAIRQGNDKLVFANTSLLAFLLATWVEVRLHKLLYEPTGFGAADRERILKPLTLYGRWRRALIVATKRAYGLSIRGRLAEDTIPKTAFDRYSTLRNTLDEEIRPLLEVRNKLAHGQWKYPLNAKSSDVSRNTSKVIRTQNISQLQYKQTIVKALAAAIHDLAVSRPTFERDFDKHYHNLVSARRNLKTRLFESYTAMLRANYRRGVEARRAAQ